MSKTNSPLRIALIGYGKMGKAIEEVAIERGHHVVMRIGRANATEFTQENLGKSDVAIEFTSPESAYKNVKNCLEWNVPVVCGSTGWTDRLPEMKELCTEKKGSFLYASNFSIGVNIFFELNEYLAKLMSGRDEYRAAMEETHHTGKKDAPSGTAITLAEQIIAASPNLKKWVNEESNDPNKLSIISKRIDPAPGTHAIRYSSEIDDIEIVHTAHSRKGFATGAVLAAEFIAGKKGNFSMKDVLNF